MGLFKVAKSAISSNLHDQWKDIIRCENLTNEVLMVKKTTPTGVISKGSLIVVEPGQCAIIYDNGRVLDATVEEGEYQFDESSAPSFFAGSIGESFKDMWTRFTFEGVASKQQAVIYFNMKEIMDNRFGTANPVPFQDWSHPLLNEMTNSLSPMRLEIKCCGKYTFKIENPALFMRKVSGTSERYTKSDLAEQMKSEVTALLQNIINELGNSEHKIPVLELPSQTDEIFEIITSRNCDKSLKERGLSILSFSIESVTLTDESESKIDRYEYNTNSFMQKGRMVDSYANAIENAASNSHGVINGMMGIGVMNMSSDNLLKDMAKGTFNTKTVNDAESWVCPKCNNTNKGEFCSNCGTKKPSKKFCSNCGKEVKEDANFCPECGTKQ